jgi:hypothetical protein
MLLGSALRWGTSWGIGRRAAKGREGTETRGERRDERKKRGIAGSEEEGEQRRGEERREGPTLGGREELDRAKECKGAREPRGATLGGMRGDN